MAPLLPLFRFKKRPFVNIFAAIVFGILYAEMLSWRFPLILFAGGFFTCLLGIAYRQNRFRLPQMRAVCLRQSFFQIIFWSVIALLSYGLTIMNRKQAFTESASYAHLLSEKQTTDSTCIYATLVHARMNHKTRLRLELQLFDAQGSSVGRWLYYPSDKECAAYFKHPIPSQVFCLHPTDIIPLNQATRLMNEGTARWLLYSDVMGIVRGELTPTENNRSASVFSRAKNTLIECINSADFSEEQTSMLELCLFGKTDNPQAEFNVRNQFQLLGLSHLLCVSGFHLGVVIGLLSLILRPCFFREDYLWLRYLLLIAFTWAFVGLCGATPALERAAGFATLYLFGRMFLRKTDGINLLAVVGTIQLLITPYELFSLSFVLSYTAVLSIFIFYKDIFALLPGLPGRLLNYLWAILCVSISVQILLWPLLLYYFGEYGFLFIWTNIPLAVLTAVMIFTSTSYMVVSLTGFPPLVFLGKGVLKEIVSLESRAVHFFEGFPSLTITCQLNALELLFCMFASYFFFRLLLGDRSSNINSR